MSKILFLAPSKSLAATASKVSKEMGLDMLIDSSDWEQAIEVTRKYSDKDIDVIISRGKTAELLKKTLGMSIVTIKVSAHDLLQKVSSIMGKGLTRIGIVRSGEAFQDSISEDFQLGNGIVLIRMCKDFNEVKYTIDQLHKNDIQAIIGGIQAIGYAAETYSLYTEYLDSGEVSVRFAIQEALNIVDTKERDRFRVAQLHAVIDNIHEGVIALTDAKKFNFCNAPARGLFGKRMEGIEDKDLQFLLSKRDEGVIEIRGKQVYTRFVPLKVGTSHRGEIVTIHEVSDIQDSERKIRLALHKKGFYAKHVFNDILGSSELIQNVVDKAIKFSKYNANVLIVGETGTGKELFAQSIHNESTRKASPFVSVNCASIPPSLMESELFGYVEGAFTGARKGGKLGLFELAHGGTIFLDEIGELSFEIQGRLLRVLQEKEVMRIGDDKIIPIDTRVICATNKNLLELVREGKFREDLYYRINVLKLLLPALRDRREDIRILFNDFIAAYENEYNKRISVDNKVISTLEEYDWSGNVRELKNLAEKTIALIGNNGIVSKMFISELLNEERPTEGGIPVIIIPETGDLRMMEREIIKRLIVRYGQEEVCRKYKISRTTLWRRMNDSLQ